MSLLLDLLWTLNSKADFSSRQRKFDLKKIAEFVADEIRVTWENLSILIT
jgi:hypothetical protein